MKKIFCFLFLSFGLTSYAGVNTPLAPVLKILNKPGAVVPQHTVNCSTCNSPEKIHASSCPAYLKDWSIDDKKNNIVKSNYNSCMSNIKKEMDFNQTVERLNGVVTLEILNSLKACAAEPERNMAVKSASTLLRFEKAESNLYHQIALMDSFLGDNLGLAALECKNWDFPRVEKYCTELKAKCSTALAAETKKKMVTNATTVEAEALRLTTEIEKGGAQVEKNKQALGILKLGSPWVFGEKFIKARKNGSDVKTAMTKQFEQTRSAYMDSLKKMSATADCFAGVGDHCKPSDFNGQLQLAPVLPEEPQSKSSTEWNQNMWAQQCIADFSFDRDQTAHTIYRAGIEAAAGLATMGIGFFPTAARVLKLAAYTERAITASEIMVVTASTHFAVLGVQEAITACSDQRHLVSLANETDPSNSCAIDGRINLGQLSEKGNCLTGVAFAMLNGLPLGQVARAKFIAPTVVKVIAPKKIPLKPEEVIAGTTKATGQRIKESNEAYLASAHASGMKTGRETYEGLDADPAMGYMQTLAGLEHKAGVRVADLGGGEGRALANICKKLPKDARCLLISLKSNATSSGQTKVYKDRNFDGISEAELRGISKEELALIHIVKDPAEQARLLNETGVDVATDFFGLAAYSGNPADTLKRSLALLKRPVDGKPSGVLFEHLGIHSPGAKGDYFGVNNIIITKDGEVLTYAEWLKTLKGIKAEVFYKKGVHDVAALQTTEAANAKITLVEGVKPVIPELEPLSFKFPNEPSAVVPRGIYMEKGAKPISLPKVAAGIKVQAPVITTGAVKDTSAAIITQGTPDKVLSSFAASAGVKGEITLNLGHEGTGFGDVTDIISNKGQLRQSLTSWIEGIPGIEVKIKRAEEKVQMSVVGKGFNKDDQLVESMVNFTHTYYPQTATIKIKDLALFKKYMEENPLTHLGNGKPGSDGLPTAMYIAE
jgi:hypothetical protein